MPEIKHNFSSGKMNKDLDERIVPNGEYRDALNIRISTSEASDVGAVNNILSNQIISNKDLLLSVKAKCVGAISDEKNDAIYWFIWSGNIADFILKLDTKNLSIIPVLVDKNKDVLKFEENNTITSINVIDDLLFWTDNINEPRKINIQNCIIGTPSFDRHT